METSGIGADAMIKHCASIISTTRFSTERSPLWKRLKLIIIASFSIIFCVFNLSPVKASDWTIEPAIEVEEVFTNNVSLAPSGIKEEDFITVITPGISIEHESNRSRIELDYRLQNLLYINDGDRNDQFHLLRIDATGEMLKDHVFLDVSLNRSTQNISNTGNTAFDNLSVSDDRANVLSYKVSPYWRQRVGSIMDIDIRYTRDELDSSRLSGSSADDFKVNLSSGPDFSRLLWDVDFNSHIIDNDIGASTRVRDVQGKLRYLFSRKLAVTSEVGYDNNSFASSGRDISGISWNFGAEWNPSTRTSLEATYGNRFFGDDLHLQLSHRSRRSQTLITFEKVPSTTRATLLEQQVFNVTDPFGDPISDPAAQDIATINVNVPTQSTEVLIRSRLKGVFSYCLLYTSDAADEN